jgi:Type ISP C-terminal specificity domain
VSKGKLRPGLLLLGLPHKKDGKPLSDADLAVSAGWGHVQTSGTGSSLVMPGSGLVEQRDYSATERAGLLEEAKMLGLKDESIFDLLGHRTCDIYLNANVIWTNVPEKVWQYKLGGYQVIKKWLSYRETAILGRALKPDEVAYVSEMVRRIAAILLLSPALDASYTASKVDAADVAAQIIDHSCSAQLVAVSFPIDINCLWRQICFF